MQRVVGRGPSLCGEADHDEERGYLIVPGGACLAYILVDILSVQFVIGLRMGGVLITQGAGASNDYVCASKGKCLGVR